MYHLNLVNQHLALNLYLVFALLRFLRLFYCFAHAPIVIKGNIFSFVVNQYEKKIVLLIAPHSNSQP